jgi:hypothetical protein
MMYIKLQYTYIEGYYWCMGEFCTSTYYFIVAAVSVVLRVFARSESFL